MEKPQSFARRATFWLFVLTTLAIYVQVFLLMQEPRLRRENAPFAGVAFAFLLCGAVANRWCGRESTTLRNVSYFATQVVLGALLIFLSPVKGSVVLVLFPVISQAVVVLHRNAALVVTALFCFATVAQNASAYGWRHSTVNRLGALAAFGFTFWFSVVVVREEEARREAEALSARLEEANQKLRGYATQVEELATTRERNRLAREIHDGLGHYLTAIAIQNEAARAIFATEPERAVAALTKAHTLTQEALEDVRRSVQALRADAPPPPLLRQLEHLAAINAGAIVEVSILGEPRPLSLPIEHTLYRTMQEGLTNVRKHAHATRSVVTLDYRDAARVRMEIEDDGRGSEREKNAGFGLNGVRERVELLRGRMEIGPAKLGGFALRVEIPA